MIHVQNRERVIGTLREELIGPAPVGEEIDCGGEIRFATAEEFRKLYKQRGSGEEILQREMPLNRYGAGILFPYLETGGEDDNVAALAVASAYVEDGSFAPEVIAPATEAQIESIQERVEKYSADLASEESDDLELATANRHFPCSMGVSLFARFDASSKMTVRATGGRYVEKKIEVEGVQRSWWLRIPVTVTAVFAGKEVLESRGRVDAESLTAENAGDLDLRVEVFSRPRPEGNRLITVTFINRTIKNTGKSRDELSLFQARFEVEVEASDGSVSNVLPYPKATSRKLDEEEESLSLLYRDVHTFGVGHGCSADWVSGNDGTSSLVVGENFPVCEVKSVTPDISDENGAPLELSMRVLAGLHGENRGYPDLERLIYEYDRWIERMRTRAQSLESSFRSASERHIAACERAADRMRSGLEFLKHNRNAADAFRMANRAILLQQIRGGRDVREAKIDNAAQRLSFEPLFEKVVETDQGRGRGYWRAFQIAFLLMNLRSTANGHDGDRETVELIWFPTGGGKTEAYLGLAAFSLFMRRLKDKEDIGVDVLMRYTLRLLTAQQFQRACGLICAMEFIRREIPDRLGDVPFSIAVWLGGAVTPNTRQDALKKLKDLQSGKQGAENPFPMLKCPWCRAKMGPISNVSSYGTGSSRRARGRTLVLGYEPSEGTVIFRCPDSSCDYSNRLPIYVIDEDIYEVRPSVVIGVVDKFASLAWNPNIRSIFGIGDDGNRICSPPGLIIQDELHLISGPLGSVVGLYETLIEELCTDRRDGNVIRPKIVSSTATIRRYKDQVKALFAREDVMLFPPSGLDVGDSFFARFSTDENGRFVAGRKYVGINAPGLGSLQNTEVRVYSALLQSTAGLPPEEQDPWWTLLIFFNALRMLGNTLTLFQSHIPNYLKTRYYRTLVQTRSLWNIEELTSRVRSDQVPTMLAKLEVPHREPNDRAIDVCLASNIIEVGIDIDRLSLIAVVGQPKSTSQYIQVTGRVGRTREKPGLVVSLFSSSKPRDRSHFEKFRSYHETLYAQVEPTSVTPFSPPALERALHAVLVGYVRQSGDLGLTKYPDPLPTELIDAFEKLILERLSVVEGSERKTLERLLAKRRREWKGRGHPEWEVGYQNRNAGKGLLRRAGEWIDEEDARVSWPTPSSMRDVDSVSEVKITRLYQHDLEEEEV